jgi:transketolase
MDSKQFVSTRDAYGKALAEMGKRESIVVLDADLSVSTKTSVFKKLYPERFFNVGCSEQNLMNTAAGLALGGKTVFASTHSQFFLRGWETIRTIIAHEKLDVKLAGTHAGITNTVDGYTHHSVEDMALMRAIPEMIVESPADAVETRALIMACVDIKKPFFIRLNRTSSPVLFDEEDYHYQLGKGLTVLDGDDLCFIATGTMVEKALEAAKLLKTQGISAGVVNIHTVKPLDQELVFREARRCGRVITVEEHSIIGGLGDAVAGTLLEEGVEGLKFRKVGIRDLFTESGAAAELYHKFGLDREAIVRMARTIL